MKSKFWQNLELRLIYCWSRLQWIAVAGFLCLLFVFGQNLVEFVQLSEEVKVSDDPFSRLQTQISQDVQKKVEKYINDLIPQSVSPSEKFQSIWPDSFIENRSNYSFDISVLVNVGYPQDFLTKVDQNIIVKKVIVEITGAGPLLSENFPRRLIAYTQRRFLADGLQSWLIGEDPVLDIRFVHVPQTPRLSYAQWAMVAVLIILALLIIYMTRWFLRFDTGKNMWNPSARQKALYKLGLENSRLFTPASNLEVDIHRGTCHIDAIRFEKTDKLSDAIVSMPVPQAYTLLENIDHAKRSKVLKKSRLSPLIQNVIDSQF